MKKYGVIFEHMPSSLDAVNFLIPYSSMPLKTAEKIMEEIKIEIHPDNIRMLDNFAIVSIVGKTCFSKRELLPECSARWRLKNKYPPF